MNVINEASKLDGAHMQVNGKKKQDTIVTLEVIPGSNAYVFLANKLVDKDPMVQVVWSTAKAGLQVPPSDQMPGLLLEAGSILTAYAPLTPLPAVHVLPCQSLQPLQDRLMSTMRRLHWFILSSAFKSQAPALRTSAVSPVACMCALFSCNTHIA